MPAAETEPALTPSKLAHIVLRTNNIDALRDFYRDFLGARLAFEEPGIMVLLRYDDEHHRIGILNFPGVGDKVEASCGLEHIAFTHVSVEELALAYKTRKEMGVLPFWSVNHGPTLSLYYRDPDGNIIETQADLMDAQAADDFMVSDAYRKNMIGVDFDPDEWLTAVQKGEDLSWFTERRDIGPRGPDSVPE